MTEREILTRIWWSLWFFGLANLVLLAIVAERVTA